jgi:hypothetical protein
MERGGTSLEGLVANSCFRPQIRNDGAGIKCQRNHGHGEEQESGEHVGMNWPRISYTLCLLEYSVRPALEHGNHK